VKHLVLRFVTGVFGNEGNLFSRYQTVLAVSLSFGILFQGGTVSAASSSGGADHQVQHFGIVFAMFSVILLAGKIGNFVERYGQPAVVGELTMGIVLAALGYFGWGFVGEMLHSNIVGFLASFGALLLLFSIGLESNLTEMKKVGFNALLVALIGVTVPFVTGTYVLAPLFFPDAPTAAKLFVGAALVATSVGLTASIFRSLGITRTRAAQTVLGAAVIDDVLGLIVLAVVSSIAAGGSVTAGSVMSIAAESFGFLMGAILLGKVVARPISTLLSKVYPGIGMKVTFAVCFMLIFGYLAEVFGLEPIIGAFAAGLILDQVHFRNFAEPEIVMDLRGLETETQSTKESLEQLIAKHKNSSVEDLVHKIGLVFIPVFFVYTGMQINFGSLLQPRLYVTAGVIALVGIAGKVVAGFAAKGKLRERLLVGSAMVPRGEVGLIFAATGRSLGVLDDELFSVIVLVVVITTFVAPPLIKRMALATHPDKVSN
jgi:Kef-type K+ transport system membrane component KefB